jgi:DNA-binding GntR family transcriptional regulator
MKTWQDHQAIVDALAAHDVLLAKQRLTEHYLGISGRLRERMGGAGAASAGQV